LAEQLHPLSLEERLARYSHVSDGAAITRNVTVPEARPYIAPFTVRQRPTPLPVKLHETNQIEVIS